MFVYIYIPLQGSLFTLISNLKLQLSSLIALNLPLYIHSLARDKEERKSSIVKECEWKESESCNGIG